MKKGVICPYCGNTKFRKIAIMATPAFGGDVQCSECQNSYWRNELEDVMKKAQSYCKSCTAKKYVTNFDCDIANLVKGIQDKIVHSVILNRPNFHTIGTMTEERLGDFVCSDEANVFGDYCDRAIFVGVSSRTEKPIQQNDCPDCGAGKLTHEPGSMKFEGVTIHKSIRTRDALSKTTYYGICCSCGLYTQDCETNDEALSAWNKGEFCGNKIVI
jgi:hypothetical protein